MIGVAPMTPHPNRLSPVYWRSVAKARFEDIQEIERELGIAAEADRIREGPLTIPTPITSGTPWNSPDFRLEVEADRQYEAAYIDRRLRALYFNISSIDRRRRVFWLWREVESADLAEAEAYMVEAEGQLGKAQQHTRSFLIAGAVAAAVAVLLAWRAGGPVALAVGGLLAFACGRWSHRAESKTRARETQTASEALCAEREIVDKKRARPPLFSDLEVDTGLPDQPAPSRAAAPTA
jgi:hypothetical protein